jgi:hypothetical protein
MDQNTPREDAAGAQPPADAGQAVPDQSQGAAAGGQEAAAEYAAWSADATYQQQAQQAADTQAYAAPQPQSATYADPGAPPAEQQPAYDQQAYAQQQQAYAQQQQAYAQQQPAYDQQAYAQQQQAYAQQQQAYAQQQQPQQPAYDQQQGQPQYYDQSAYGQQPGYYDQSAYGQQPPPQQGYQQPYAYGQPAQGQPAWPGDSQYWEEGQTGYGRSFLAVLAGFAMLTWGLVIAIGGGLVIWTNDILGHLSDLTLSAEVTELVQRADDEVVATGGILLILGIVMIIGAIGIFAHRKWGRAFGIVIGLLGTILGIGVLIAAIGFEILNGAGYDTVIEGEEASVGAGIVIAGSFLLILLGMLVGRRHFRKKGVER